MKFWAGSKDFKEREAQKQNNFYSGVQVKTMVTIKVLENEKDRIKIDIDDLTLVNILNDNIWSSKGISYSAYKIEHPYLSNPVLYVKGSNLRKRIIDAAEKVISDAESVKKQLGKA